MNSNGAGARIDPNDLSESSRTPPGSNSACDSYIDSDADKARLRREWNHLDDYDRALYLDAVETAIERGLHQRFALFHFDEISGIQAHDTCGFYLWHRTFVLAYENMLRSLEPRFACLALPFWDIYRDYGKQESATNSCRSFATCAKIINDLGGIVENDDIDTSTFFGRKVEGLWHFKPPLQNLRDDNNRVGLVRYDMWFDPIPEETVILSVENIARLFGMVDRVAFWEVLHHGIHDSVHDTIGGFMRTPASPIDPLFMPWHSTMELFDYIWEACHYSANENKRESETNYGTANHHPSSMAHGIGANEANCAYTPKAQTHFPNISLSRSTDEVYMKLDNTTDIRDDPRIGTYFSQAMSFADLWSIRDLDKHHRFRYAGIPDNFVRALANNTQACPNGLASIVPLPPNATNSVGVARRQPPAFSNEQLEAFQQDWIEEAEAYYNGDIHAMNTANGNAPTLGRQQVSKNSTPTTTLRMEFVKCILFEAMDRDTIERWAIDRDAFLTQVVVNERYNSHPLCRDRLFGASAVFGMDTEGGSSPGGSMTSSSGAYRGGLHDSCCWLLPAIVLICLVSTISR